MKKTLIFIYCIMILLLANLNTICVNAYGWGYNKNKEHAIVDVGIYEREIAGTDSYYVGSKGKIYLTFDAGYDNGNIEKIINILVENDVPSTVFCTGDFIEREKDIIKKLDENNIAVGNHTYSHKNITKISDEILEYEIKHTEELYKEITGKEMVKQFRPPEGQFDKVSLSKVKNLGYRTFFWSIAYLDWDVNNQKGFTYTYNSVIDNLHDGAIILMHTVSDDNVSSLTKIIKTIKNKGYEFDSLENIN